MARVWLEKVKRPGGSRWYRFDEVGVDDDGCWLHGPVGSRWSAPHDSGLSAMAVVLQLVPGRPWVPWWVDDPDGRRLELDVCHPPTRNDAGWRFVDLELDVLRHEVTGHVALDDEDELGEGVAEGWMTAADEGLARRTAADLLARLSGDGWAWQERGWELLATHA